LPALLGELALALLAFRLGLPDRPATVLGIGAGLESGFGLGLPAPGGLAPEPQLRRRLRELGAPDLALARSVLARQQAVRLLGGPQRPFRGLDLRGGFFDLDFPD